MSMSSAPINYGFIRAAISIVTRAFMKFVFLKRELYFVVTCFNVCLLGFLFSSFIRLYNDGDPVTNLSDISKAVDEIWTPGLFGVDIDRLIEQQFCNKENGYEYNGLIYHKKHYWLLISGEKLLSVGDKLNAGIIIAANRKAFVLRSGATEKLSVYCVSSSVNSRQHQVFSDDNEKSSVKDKMNGNEKPSVKNKNGKSNFYKRNRNASVTSTNDSTTSERSYLDWRFAGFVFEPEINNKKLIGYKLSACESQCWRLKLAGLHVNDVVTHLQGKQLINYINQRGELKLPNNMEKTVHIRLLRDGKNIAISLSGKNIELFSS
ncbi:hypothetical protein [Serratia quinivorans]|uniref:hypothetical protein n=1 Tax=Serratia quinivorans TaxID=137545 RepID=UPI0021797100|nr:hypothetical protein [Serratia quinivorans]CAI1113794.1 Uncharacterised protein [Serratia quinivorans]CAI1875616.1 Uncharacterised protein [Serratia quinivorans]